MWVSGCRTCLAPWTTTRRSISTCRHGRPEGGRRRRVVRHDGDTRGLAGDNAGAAVAHCEGEITP